MRPKYLQLSMELWSKVVNKWLLFRDWSFFLILVRALFRPAKIAEPTVFQVVLRGIGKSFQSAITAPRINLTGYGNATAQSWLITNRDPVLSKGFFLPCGMWLTLQSRSWLLRMSINIYPLRCCAVSCLFINNFDRFYPAVVYVLSAFGIYGF